MKSIIRYIVIRSFFLTVVFVGLSACEEEEITQRVFTVTFDSDGGNPESISIQVPFNETVSLPEYPVKEGFDMIGWYWSLDPTREFDYEYAQINGDIELVAKWESGTGIRHKVTFDARGGLPNPVTQSVIANTKARQPLNPAWTDPEINNPFRGWFLDEDLTQSFSFKNANVTSDITLYAKWAQDN